MSLVLSATVVVLFSWAILGLLLTALGMSVRRLAGLPTTTFEQLFISYWLGHAATLVVLQVWHLALPVDRVCFIAFTVVAVASLAWNARELWNVVRRVRLNGWVVLFVLLTIVLANVATGPPSNYDTGTYHYHVVRWSATYPIVPGLANLHSRLGYNNSSLLLGALLDSGVWGLRAQHIAVGLIIIPLLGQLVLAVRAAVRWKEPLAMATAVVLLTGARTIYLSSDEVTGFSTDVPVFGLAVVVLSLLSGLLLDEIHDARERCFRSCAIVFLCAVTLTIKMSFAIFGGVVAVIALALLWRERSALPGFRLPALTILASVVAVGTWMVRGIITSGYPLFPQTLGAMPVEWRVPLHATEVGKYWIYAWARKPFGHWKDSMFRWDWIPEWWLDISGNTWDFRVPLALTALAAAAIIATRKSPAQPRRWLLLVPALLSFIFWLLTAPGLRLGAGTFWMIAAGAGVVALQQIQRASMPRLQIVSRAALVAVVALSLTNVRGFVIGPGEDEGFHPALTTNYFKYVTDNNVTLLIPRDHHPCSWDAPLPTTPYPHPRLAYRRNDDPASGFKVEPFDENVMIGYPP